jgi:DNA (cytosine-5)-methyltransferase 1
MVVLENVPGLLSSHGGRDYGIVLRTLGDIGYGLAWRVLDSRHFGVPQSRRRLYIVGYTGDPARAYSLLFEPECGSGHLKKGRRPGQKSLSPFKEVVGDPSVGPVVPRVGYCLAATSGRHTGTDWSRTYVTYPDAVRRITPLEAERLQGFPDGWTIPPDKSIEEIEELDSPRYAALGNAVTVPVAAWIGSRIIRTRRASTDALLSPAGAVPIDAAGA